METPREPETWSLHDRIRAVLQVLSGEHVREVSREFGMPAHLLEAWYDLFLAGGTRALREGEAGGRDAELRFCWQKVGELVLTLDRRRRREGASRSGRAAGGDPAG